ncbi:MAG: hypothetical protein ABIP94_04715, partial [Planctomycetota bacterium]
MLILGTPTSTGRRTAWLLLPVLGFALGLFVAPQLWRTTAPPAKPTPPPAPRPLPPASPLPLLQVSIEPDQWAVLAKQQQQALAAGYLVQDDAAIVPATVRLGDEVAHGTARLKGDLLDHINTDQWSLRFDLSTPIAGRRRFSVMHPQTRGYVMEWLVMKTARYMNVLAPRVDFVHVAINGADPKIYYLEEHASKELLESQGRREGPIVRFDESAMWGTWLQYGFYRTGVLPPDVERAASFFDAKAEAFGESSLQPLDVLNERLLRALHQARDLQSLAISQELAGQTVRQLLAIENLEGRTIDDLFAIDKLGKWLALTSFFGGVHGLLWNQMRFYYDPVVDRLEPVVFDTGSSLPLQSLLILLEPELRWFRSSPRVMAAAYQELGRMVEPGWIEGLRQA